MYPTNDRIEEMLEVIDLFITSTSVDGMKPKREKVIRDIYGNTYDIQLAIRGILKLIDISHLLGENDIFLPHLCEEYGKLKAYCNVLSEELKRMQPVKEHSDDVKNILVKFKAKDILSMYYEDLKYISDVLEIDVDIKESMSNAKSYEFSDEEKIKINEQLDKYYFKGNSLRKKL
jgi:hypothetical protein